MTCPTCGSPVTVVSDDEGTSHYRPADVLTLDEAGVEPLAQALWRLSSYRYAFDPDYRHDARALIDYLRAARETSNEGDAA